MASGLLIDSLTQAMSHAYLSGNALNLPWLGQAALRLVAPATYGPLPRGHAILTSEAWLVPTLDPWIVLPFRCLFLLQNPQRRELILDLLKRGQNRLTVRRDGFVVGCLRETNLPLSQSSIEQGRRQLRTD